jgi:hypothetical protein
MFIATFRLDLLDDVEVVVSDPRGVVLDAIKRLRIPRLQLLNRR